MIDRKLREFPSTLFRPAIRSGLSEFLLTISATKVPEKYWRNWWTGKERCFSSGLLISDKRFTFKYGYMEGRFQLPAVRAYDGSKC